MQNPKESFIKRAVVAKKRAESGLQELGARVVRNVAQGQKDLQSGKSKYYGSINPFKK